MSGLLTKDFRLITQRKESFLMFIIIAAVMGYAMDGSFVVGYMTLLGTTLGIGTLSYDEMDNGMPFIMTWPISRKTYCLEKYIFCSITAVASWAFGLIAYFAVNTAKNAPFNFLDEFPGMVAFLPVMIIILSIMLPVEVKFGMEKSRVIMLIVFGALGASIVFLSGIVGGSENRFLMLAAKLSEFNPVVVIGVMVVGALIICLVSYLLTCKIMNKKEF
ncbi:MAG: ABC-2 transporter permease [Lachnospiraceae bacterium]|nr:ABC-2 transporter permease [Lachnospiraceae bacterium]